MGFDVKGHQVVELDIELEAMPPELRWREWMMRVEAIIFASGKPVKRSTLSQVVGRDCSVDLLVEDIRQELAGRPYDIVEVGHGWQFRTRPGRGDITGIALGEHPHTTNLNSNDMLVLATIAYHQPVSRRTIAEIVGRDVGREVFGRLRASDMIGLGPRSPEPGAPYTYVTTDGFLEHFGLFSLGELPPVDLVDDTGLLHDMSSDSAVEMPIAGAFDDGNGDND